MRVEYTATPGVAGAVLGLAGWPGRPVRHQTSQDRAAKPPRGQEASRTQETSKTRSLVIYVIYVIYGYYYGPSDDLYALCTVIYSYLCYSLVLAVLAIRPLWALHNAY